MIEITLNENGSVSNREIFIGFTGENLDKTLHFTYPEKYQSYHKYILVNHSVDGTFCVLPINDDKFVVSTYLTSKKYGWELQVMFTEDELDLSAETVDLSPKEGKHQKLFKKIWCGIDRGLYSGEAINAFEEDENVKIFYDKIVAMINNGGTSGGVSSWNDLTDKPFYEDEQGEVVPLDEKFIPSSIARKSDLDGISVSEEDIANAIESYMTEHPVKIPSEYVTEAELKEAMKDITTGGGSTTVDTTKTISVGTEGTTLASNIAEQSVNLTWNVPSGKTVPPFTNYYIEKSGITYPRTFNASEYTQFWSVNGYHGTEELYVSGHEYFQAFHYTMDGESVGMIGNVNSYISPTNSKELTGSGWVYMMTKPTKIGQVTLNLTNTGSGTGTIEYVYCIDVTALQENGTITAKTINELAELFGELELVPGQNFEGISTSGNANLIITRNGTESTIASTETTATVKGGDVLKTDSGTVIFTVNVKETVSSSAIWENKKWVAFGDSLTDETINADKKYYRYIAEKTGIEVVVMGKGGTGYYITQDSGTCYYQRMENVPSDADIITIFGSINDWKYYQHSIEIGTATDTLDSGTLCGYMNKCIDVAIEKAPYSQIALISAPYYHGLGTDRQEELCNALQGVARHRRVKFLDLYHESGFRIDNPTFAQQYTTDYSTTNETFGHPNNAFHEKFLAPDFMELLKRMLLE